MTDFRPGDRVRVTPRWYETTVDETGYYSGKNTVSEGHATVELIERADDPRKDPVGTVRRSPGGTVVVRNADFDSASWEVFVDGDDNPELYKYLSHDDVTGWKIVGAVPLTPAAEKQAADELSAQTRQAEQERPLWTGDGSEEPPEYVTKVVDNEGDELTRDKHDPTLWWGTGHGYERDPREWGHHAGRCFRPYTEVRA